MGVPACGETSRSRWMGLPQARTPVSRSLLGKVFISLVTFFPLRFHLLVVYAPFMFAGIVLILVVSLYRLVPWFGNWGTDQPSWFVNFSPMAALVLCSAACLPRRWAFTLPFVALIGTDLILNWHYAQPGTAGFPFWSVELLSKTIAFVLIAAFGRELQKQPRARVLLPAALGSSLFFYLVTNTASWLSEPRYGSTFSGWAQALTTGLPQYLPTWVFFRNTLVSDMLFTALFLACIRVRPALREGKARPAAAW